MDEIEGSSSRKEPLLKAHGRSEQIVLVSDVSTTGTTILKAAEMIKEAGGCVNAAFVLYDRGESTSEGVTVEESLEKHGIRLVSMTKAKTLKSAVKADARLRKVAKEKGVVGDDTQVA